MNRHTAVKATAGGQPRLQTLESGFCFLQRTSANPPPGHARGNDESVGGQAGEGRAALHEVGFTWDGVNGLEATAAPAWIDSGWPRFAAGLDECQLLRIIVASDNPDELI